MSPDDIFRSFFGGSGFSSFFGGGEGRGPKKGEDLVHEIPVSLTDLYVGKTSKLAVTRDVLCKTCNGYPKYYSSSIISSFIRNGTKGSSAPAKCKTCEGRGIRLVVRQLGPGMIQQMQTVCSDCKGKGEIIKEEDRCPECKGKKVNKEKKVMQVVIEPGMKHGQKIVFANEANEEVRKKKIFCL
jgi:DnaJ family protein A protein 2